MAAIGKKHIEKDWLKGAIHHLDLLCKESHQYEDEGDIPPTDKGMKSAKELMSQIAKSSPPQIAISVNGEILFSWDTATDSLTACVATDGTIKFYKNHVLIDRLMFVRHLNTTVAA